MHREGLVPSLLVIGVVPSLPVINKPLPKQRGRITALSMAHAEIATVISELGNSQAIKSKLPPATQFLFCPGDIVHVYKEKDRWLCGPAKIIITSEKVVTVTDGLKTEIYGIIQVISSTAATKDHDLRKLLSGLEKHMHWYIPAVFLSEILAPSEPRATSTIYKPAVTKDTAGSRKRGCFYEISRRTLDSPASITRSRFVFAL